MVEDINRRRKRRAVDGLLLSTFTFAANIICMGSSAEGLVVYQPICLGGARNYIPYFRGDGSIGSSQASWWLQKPVLSGRKLFSSKDDSNFNDEENKSISESMENISSLFDGGKTGNKRSDIYGDNKKSRRDGNSSKIEATSKNKQEQLNRLLEYPSFLGSEGLDRDLESSAGKTSFLDKSPLEGVLPVSELFYRSTPESIEEDDGDDEEFSIMEQDPDDEELPFSAEQSNSLETYCNKVQIRRNQADETLSDESDENDDNEESEENEEEDENSDDSDGLINQIPDKQMKLTNASRRRGRMRKKKKLLMLNKRSRSSDALGEVASLFVQDSKPSNENNHRSKGQLKNRKMVRRGMEMLVGGEPINADPPLRVVDLHFDYITDDWAKVITLNSRDFGPLLHTQSVSKVSPISRGLYCEHFVSNALKWNVCPEYLKDVVNWYNGVTTDSPSKQKVASYSELLELMTSRLDEVVAAKKEDEDYEKVDLDIGVSGTGNIDPTPSMSPGVGFGPRRDTKNINKRQSSVTRSDEDEVPYALQSELKFTIGISATELEKGEGGGFRVLRRILARGIESTINVYSLDFFVRVSRLVVTEEEDGTEIDACFDIIHKSNRLNLRQRDKLVSQMNQVLAQAVDSGDMVIALAKSTREENAWSPHFKAKVISEMIMTYSDEFDDIADIEIGNDVDDDLKNSANIVVRPSDLIDDSKPFEKSDSRNFAPDDIFLGNGNGGVFPNYAENNKEESPFSGNIGPLLLDAVVEKSKQNQPRVITIGDVHGCIDELQALLRRCNYRPGDVVIFLGDLVSKGPDSLSVVQMAREIGAIGVRGNHDFEVIRWHQAIKSGADPPGIASDHFNIASSLDSADLKWLYSLPWYLSSKELNSLFVHAGFVSGIRLAKQNPRLMMNMRSILPDGTVTSKFFHNWPWARLWDGPQTVFFGHDADRGLQQYEHAVGLDTGCVYGGRLSACILPEKRLVSVSAKREYFQYRRKHYD